MDSKETTAFSANQSIHDVVLPSMFQSAKPGIGSLRPYEEGFAASFVKGQTFSQPSVEHDE